MRPAPANSSLFYQKPTGPDDAHECALLKLGFQTIAGVDEAGRGPLAGPVVAAAVVLDLNNIPPGLNDSKKLTARQRQRLFGLILNSAHAVSIASVAAETIDEINILQATMMAMQKAICGLALTPDHVLIDGNRVPEQLLCGAMALIKGDQLSVSIAAASIVAKVTRDQMMTNAAQMYDEYGFDSNKGYGSAVRHTDAIEARGGIARLHRFSFSPLKNL